MSADEAQSALSLPVCAVLFVAAVGAAALLGMVLLRLDDIEQAHADLPTADEPDPVATEPLGADFERRVSEAVALSNRHPAHVHVRRRLLRSVRASLQPERWTGETDAELAELLRGGLR